ncbi:MAG: O-methyltransferase [Solirubrobacterales bacterium]
MSAVTQDYIENYIRSLIKNRDSSLIYMEEYARQNHVPIIQKDSANLLEFFITLLRPKKILELGTAIGYSSIIMSKCAGPNTKITTVERDEKLIQQASINIKNFGLENNINILQGDCLDILKNLDGEFDIIFMDAGKSHYKDYFPYCAGLLKEGGIIISDNVLFRGMVASDELFKRRMVTIIKKMRKYLEMLSNNDEFITSVIPMGDGIAVTTRRNLNE